jgi:CheY-like chemotaxis protein
MGAATGAGKLQDRVRRLLGPLARRLWTIDVRGLDKLLAFKSSVEVPYTHITRVERGIEPKAWEELQKEDAPRLAILDWMMPEMDGPDVCRRVRQELPLANMYLLLVTARESRRDVVAGLNAGADDYIIKPFDPDELRARVAVGARVLGLQQKLAERVEELQTALSSVKQLRGLLPICSYCKRIRGDDQYWQQVEGYVAAHSDAQFSHGICPPCYEKISAELDEMSRNKLPRNE